MSSRLLYLVYKALHSPVLRPVNNFPLCLGLRNSLGVTVLLQAITHHTFYHFWVVNPKMYSYFFVISGFKGDNPSLYG